MRSGGSAAAHRPNSCRPRRGGGQSHVRPDRPLDREHTDNPQAAHRSGRRDRAAVLDGAARAQIAGRSSPADRAAHHRRDGEVGDNRLAGAGGPRSERRAQPRHRAGRQFGRRGGGQAPGGRDEPAPGRRGGAHRQARRLGAQCAGKAGGGRSRQGADRLQAVERRGDQHGHRRCLDRLHDEPERREGLHPAPGQARRPLGDRAQRSRGRARTSMASAQAARYGFIGLLRRRPSSPSWSASRSRARSAARSCA